MIRGPVLWWALAAGLSVLLAGIVGLERVFLRERQEALEGLVIQKSALEGYAARELQERCEEELEAGRPRLKAALDDPLVDGSDLLHVRAGLQRLPRRFTFLRAAPQGSEALYEQLVSGTLPTNGLQEDDPWLERLRNLDRFREALASARRESIEDSFRSILTHRARFVIDARKDLHFQVALLDLLEGASEPDPELMRMMLRDGLPDSRGTRMPGLQAQLLSNREKLTRKDFGLLADRITRLAERSAVRHDDFSARVKEPSAAVVSIPEALRFPSLLHGGRWFVAPSEDGGLEGVAVDLDALLVRTREEMLERGLLEEEDELAVPSRPISAAPVLDLGVEVVSPRWERSRAAIERRFWLKSGLAVALLGLTWGGIGSWAAWTRRERQLVALKSDFVATISHELRTPLASMRLMAETLARRLEDVDAARDYPRRLVREIDSLDFLVENVLSFHRLEKGKWEPHVEDVPLSEVVRTLERDLPAATGARVEVRMEHAIEASVRADPELIRLLFLNLGTNACKYNEEDRVVLRIETVEGRPTLVRLADNGTGIRSEEMDKVFSEFYRAERGGRGFGLGLAICRRIMDLHGGWIRVAETSTKGTVFEMCFP